MRLNYCKKILWLICMSLITVLTLSVKSSAGETIDDLIIHLRSKDTQNQFLAIEKLGGVKDKRAIDELLKFVFTRAEDWKLKIRAILLLGDIPDPEVSDRLVTIFNNPFLNEECPAIKWNTAIALGKSFNKGSRAVDSLIDALGQNDILMREVVIQSLGKIGDVRAVPFLIPALNDKSFAIKFGTIKALGNIGDPQAIPFLKQIAKNDNDPYIKGEALSV